MWHHNEENMATLCIYLFSQYYCKSSGFRVFVTIFVRTFHVFCILHQFGIFSRLLLRNSESGASRFSLSIGCSTLDGLYREESPSGLISLVSCMSRFVIEARCGEAVSHTVHERGSCCRRFTITEFEEYTKEETKGEILAIRVVG